MNIRSRKVSEKAAVIPPHENYDTEKVISKLKEIVKMFEGCTYGEAKMIISNLEEGLQECFTLTLDSQFLNGEKLSIQMS